MVEALNSILKEKTWLTTVVLHKKMWTVQAKRKKLWRRKRRGPVLVHPNRPHRAFVDMYETPHTEQMHTIERFRMTDNGLRMEVNLHVEDSGAFTTPWNAIQRYRRVEPGVADNNEPFNPLSSASRAGPMLEASCAENPNSLFGAEGALPVPQAEKPNF